jgi:hypothetical protein
MYQQSAAASDTTLDQLRTKHGSLDARLQQLDRHRSLSPEEQYEVQIIKKRKLALKDRIESLQS